ncbi:MAG: hypothetical protein IJ231_05825 [Clostridia bacterium]|nr:hypothetical protein [Clostridia bacterium]
MYFSDTEPYLVVGRHYTVYYDSRGEQKEAYETAVQWMEEHHSNAPVEKKNRISYLFIVDDQFMEVSLSGNGRRPSRKGSDLGFIMLPISKPDEVLTEYGYESKEEVPLAPGYPWAFSQRKNQ